MAYRRTTRVDEQLADRRANILKAARDFILQDKYRDASIASIAARAGIATGTVYRYFPSKVELLAEVVREVSERELDIICEIARQDALAADRLASAIHVFLDRAVRGGRLAYLLIADPIDAGTAIARLGYRRKLAGVLAELVKEGIVREEFPEQAAHNSAAALVGILIECLIQAFSERGQIKKARRKAFIEQTAELCLWAIRRRPPG